MNRAFLIAATLSLAATSQVLAADLPPAAAPPRGRRPPTFLPRRCLAGRILSRHQRRLRVGQSSWNNAVDGSTGNFNTSGFLIGGTLGANYQIGAFVIGLEGDGDWNDANGST